jgi:hypothetical protein
LQREKLELPGKKLTLQTSEEYLTNTAINLNPYSKKCGMNPLNNKFLIQKGTAVLFGSLQKIGEKPHRQPQYANTQHLQDHGQKATRKRLIYLLSIFQKFSLIITTIQYQKKIILKK